MEIDISSATSLPLFLMSIAQYILTTGAGLAAFGAYKLFKVLYGELSSPLRHLPGPPNTRFFLGNIQEVFDQYTAANEWIDTYGPTFQVKGPFGISRLFTLDPKAQGHILMNGDLYERPLIGRQSLARVVGPGLLVAEGEAHKRQRRVMNPAFGNSQIRDLTTIFVEKSIELRERWLEEITKEKSKGTIDALSWLSRMSLDVIGLAGFNYSFNALKGEPNELNIAFSTIFRAGTQSGFLMLLRLIFPVLTSVKTPSDRITNNAQSIMRRIGNQLLSSSKAAVTQSRKGAFEEPEQFAKSRTLLSLLVKANTSDDIPESSRLSDEDVLAQIPTFLVVGHETTSTATAWALFSLSQHPEIQSSLREELLAVPTDIPSMDDLDALPYLDRVVHDVIPLSHPVTDIHGVVHHSIQIKAGQIIMLPIASTNTFVPIWGEDATEFIPDRWIAPPEASRAIPGIWSNQLTFLGGSRACIGYKFSLIEMKAFLFTLLRAFEFELAVPASDIMTKSMIVQKPMLKSNPKAGNVLPMRVTPVKL
ncbi:hypothetical protein ONZ45_g12995 [Pleurotus djamor]|nr:hypothetical protein ONZ45_g12995 [Pleurotus djamor]